MTDAMEAGALLVGGRGRRMGGVAKGRMERAGRPLAAHICEALAEVCGAVFLVGDDAAPYAALGWPIAPDVVSGAGAPGGVLSALRAAPAGTDWVFVVACDMPRFGSDLVDGLRPHRGAVGAVWSAGGRMHPLCGWWSPALASAIEDALPAGPSLRHLVRTLGLGIVEHPDAARFDNVNTPEDAARAGLTVR